VGVGQGGDEEGEAEVAHGGVGDLLADGCSPAVLDFLRNTDAGRTAPTVEGNSDSEEQVEEEEMGEGGGSGVLVVTPGLFVLGSLLCFFLSFQKCVHSLVRLLLFHTLYLLGALTVRSICRRAGLLPSGPTLGPGRQTRNI